MKTTIKRTSRLSSALYGLKLPFVSFRLISSTPTLILWSIIPIVITIFIYIGFLSQINSHLFPLISAKLAQWGLNESGWISNLVLILAKLALVILSAMTFSFATSIVACPFNDVLAERTEKLSTPLMKVVTHQTFLFKLKILGIDLLKSIATLVTGVFILLLSWIPGVNILALPIGCALFCFQYISYPQTRRGIGMLGGVAFIARHFYSSLGFGASVAFLFSIPLLSLFALPLAVVGGTLLVARANGDDTLPALR